MVILLSLAWILAGLSVTGVTSREMAGQLVQCAVPARPVRVAVFNRAKALLTQGQFGLSAEIIERDGDERLPRLIAFPAPGEGETPGRLYHLEDAGHGDHASVGHAHYHAIAAADAGLEQRNLAMRAFGSDPGLPFLPGQPGVEDARGRRVEDARDLQNRIFRRHGHGFFPFAGVFKWALRRSKLPLQKR